MKEQNIKEQLNREEGAKLYDFAIILGATGGIGSSITWGLIRKTKWIYLLGRNSEDLGALKGKLDKLKNAHIQANPINFEDSEQLIQETIEDLNLQNGMGVIVNCVGTYVSQEFAQSTYAEINQHFLINAIRPMQIIATLINYLQPGSLIINIGSSLSVAPKAQRVLTSAVKHAVRGFSLSLAEELASSGIRVCLVNPRSVATSLLKKNSAPESYLKAMPVEDLTRAVMMMVESDPKTLFREIDVGASQGFLGR
ncbi:MAG: SDR family oxidoreductase [Cyanobacteria bacterium P01_G01_bin.54]